MPIYELKWALCDQTFVLAHSELATFVNKPPLDNVKRMIKRGIAHKAFANMKNSTSDLSQAKA